MSHCESEAGAEDLDHKPSGIPVQQGTEELMIGIGAPSEPERSLVVETQEQNMSELDSGQEESSSLSNKKRPRDGANAPVADFAHRRQKAACIGGESIFEKLKIETEQLIENPEQTLGPDLVHPGQEGITTFHDNDVLSGRGGGTNVHPGNRNFRDLINMHRRLYLKARKNDKPAISRAIVRSIRNNEGRFLKKDDKSGLWYEIGDDAAREKTSQALRQRAPEMRKILFDTEREEARVATEQQLRQRSMMGIFTPNTGTVMPMASITPGPIHPGMMAYAPGTMAPMMFVNPAVFVQPPQQQQQQGSTTNSSVSLTPVQPTMQQMMMLDQYQQAAMFQFMANPMMMNPFMQFQQPDQNSPQCSTATQLADGSGSNSLVVASSPQDNPCNDDKTEIPNEESPIRQESKRDSIPRSDNNSIPGESLITNASPTEDYQAEDSSGENRAVAAI